MSFLIHRFYLTDRTEQVRLEYQRQLMKEIKIQRKSRSERNAAKNLGHIIKKIDPKDLKKLLGERNELPKKQSDPWKNAINKIEKDEAPREPANTDEIKSLD